jgi:hypothetical protein
MMARRRLSPDELEPIDNTCARCTKASGPFL